MNDIRGRIERLRHLFGPDHAKYPNADLGLALAAELEWSSGPANVDPRPVPGLGSVVRRGFIGKTPAVLFATDFSGGALAIREVASYAYQSSIEWGLITNRAQTVLFNSHWAKNRDWFQLPIAWDPPSHLSDLLSAFTPDGVQKGILDARARTLLVEDDRLSPVDDVLVDILDAWRDRAFETAQSDDEIDAAVQTLFSQLFILRAIEDRGLAPQLTPLSQLLQGPGADANLDLLGRLFDHAATAVQSDLFEERPFAMLPSTVVGGIIRDLYTPPHSAIKDFKYNFAWITADVLGRAYEKYLSSIIIARPKRDRQMSMFEEPLRESRRVSMRKESGVYYTPNFVVQYLTKRCLEQFFRIHPLVAGRDATPHRLPKVIDASCGSGSFLTATVDALITRLKRVRPTENWGRRIVTERCIVGVDKDPRAVRLAQLSVWLRLAEEPDPLPLPSLKQNIVAGDSLEDGVWKTLPDCFDIALGNPPFIPSVAVENRSFLERTFAVARGRFDVAHLFLELCDRKLGAEGLLGMVVPNRLFTSRDAGTVRAMIANDFDLLTVIDFGSSGVFADASTYVGVLVALKAGRIAIRPRLRYMRVAAIPERFPEWMLECADASEHEFTNSHVTAFNTSQPPRDDFWYFISPAKRAARIALEQDSTPLGDLALVRQGIKTGANDIFVVEVLTRTERHWRIRNALGETFLLEPTLLHPVVFGSDIQRYELSDTPRYLIYPYRESGVIRPDDLATEFPLLNQYFHAYEDVLRSRRHDLGGHKFWYELARKRSLEWLKARKLLSRELAQESSFALDSLGSTFLIGGIVVQPADESLLEPLLAYLNSRFVTEYLGERAPEFRSAFLKLERQVLERLPIPNRLLTDPELQYQLTGHAVRLSDRDPGDDESYQHDEDRVNHAIDAVVGGRGFAEHAMPAWLAQAVAFDVDGDTARAMDVLYDGFDRALRSNPDEVNELIGQLPLDRVSLQLMVGTLSITLPLAPRFQSRQRVFDRAWRECENTGRDPNRLLNGLREWSPVNGEGTSG